MRKTNWGLLYIGLPGIEAFNDMYGFVAGDEVLRFAALIMVRPSTRWDRQRTYRPCGGDDLSSSRRRPGLRDGRGTYQAL